MKQKEITLNEFKKSIDERLNQVEKVQTDWNKPSDFNLLANRINDIVDTIVLSRDVEELKNASVELNSVKKVINTLRNSKDLSLEDYASLNQIIKKIEPVLKESFQKLGGKTKKGKLTLPKDTIKGKIKSRLTENLGESIGAAALAITDSPLLLIAGQWFDEHRQKKKEKKAEQFESEQRLLEKVYEKKLDELDDYYKERKKKKKKETPFYNNEYDSKFEKKLESINDEISKQLKEKKDPKNEKFLKEIQDVLKKVDDEQLNYLTGIKEKKDNTIAKIKEIEDKSDEAFKNLLGDMNVSAKESADELGLSPEIAENFQKEFQNLPKEEPTPIKEEPKISAKEDLLPDTHKYKKHNESDLLFQIRDLAKTYLPSIDNSLLSFNHKWDNVNSEDQINARDKWLEIIAKHFDDDKKTGVKEKIKKKSKSIFDNLTSKEGLVKLLTGMGKGLLMTGAFLVGWKIGKEIDNMLGLTDKIQFVVDKLQASVEERFQKFKKENFTKHAIENTEKNDELKKKLGTDTYLSNKSAYELLKNPEQIKKFTESEQKLIKKKASMYEPFATQMPQKSQIPIAPIQESKPTITPEKASTTQPVTSPLPVAEKKELPKPEKMKIANVAKEITPEKLSDTSILDLKPGVDVLDMQPDVRTNLLNMASEYQNDTGSKLHVNSAKRTTEQQKKLYEENPEKAAPPGLSMHEFGYAADIDSKDVDELDKLGLMNKYGFDRPITREPWHIEPEGLKPLYSKIRKGMAVDSPQRSSVEMGDAENFAGVRKNYFKKQNIDTGFLKGSTEKGIQNNVVSQNTTIVKPKDYRFFIDDDFLRKELYNYV
jgi:hypothetical protein